MKKQVLRITTAILAILMIVPLVLSSCGKKTMELLGVEPDSEKEIKIYALSGTTALGMAQMKDAADKNTDDMNYQISLHSDPQVVANALVSGECAIAALPTNLAAKLYKKSEGKVKLLALNTLGVLYVLDTTGTVNTLADLRGKTVYVPGSGSNPEYVTLALLKGAGLTVGTDVTVDTTSYASPDALQGALAAGQAQIAILPEPKVSAVTAAVPNTKVAIDLTEEWEKLYGENTLVQGCLVINKDFADAHPVEVKKFLEDYKKSVDFISAGSDDAINMIVNAGILPKPQIAKKALPNCNICCITGEAMKASIGVFYEKIFALDPTSIGGSLPDDGFYYIAQ
ncbi:MAG: ABC transporter substrate-binding protein [Ruminococcaceae bacterium]|nr:ABC transporter substrate-binding protein [Oscillospiraceae bacterium]